jgi:hypothetical protein
MQGQMKAETSETVNARPVIAEELAFHRNGSNHHADKMSKNR